MKKNLKYCEKDQKESLRELFTSHSYTIDFTIPDSREELSVSERSSFAYHVSDLSRKALLGLFKLVASESLKDNYVENTNEEFGNLVNLLFERFSLDQLDEKGSLEDAVLSHIKELEENVFYIPDILAELSPVQLKPNDVGMHYCDSDTLVNIFRDVLKSLREEKINFWKALFKRYKNDKEGLDLEFRTKVLRQEKDINNLSKITDEDIKSLL